MIADTVSAVRLHIVLMFYHIVIHAALIHVSANNSFFITLAIGIKAIHRHIYFFFLLELLHFGIYIFNKWK